MLDATAHGSRLPTRTVLLLVDDAVVRELLALSFRHAGFFAMSAANLAGARHLAAQVQPDLIVVDLDTPGLDDPAATLQQITPGGEEAAATPAVPWVGLSSQTSPHCDGQRKAGAALLCVSKPFVPRALVSQVLDALRQHASGGSSPRGARARAAAANRPVQVGALTLDPARHCLTLRLAAQGEKDAHEVELAPVEIKLLRCLMLHSGQVLSRQEIVGLVWPTELSVEPRTVDQNIKRLRRTLHNAGAADAIRTVHGVGYRFVAPSAP